MAGVCVIVAYRPKPGKEGELLSIVRGRVPTLRQEGLVTERAPVIMRAKDGTIVEVSEWKSPEAIEAAHQNPNVLAMWNRFLRSATVSHSTAWPKRRKCSRALRPSMNRVAR